MRTIQMTLDDELVKTVDRVAKKLKTTRSAFTRDALRLALGHLERRRLEEKHRTGYARKPVSTDEFALWETEQAWGDQ
jgi:metal-responsive CopG/Arc/MetJ family transcriptional regulator